MDPIRNLDKKICSGCGKKECAKCVEEGDKSFCCQTCCDEYKKEKEETKEETINVCRFC